MAIAQRRAKHGHAVIDAVLLGHQHIGVTFHHDRAAIRFEVVASDIEAVQLATLGKQRGLGRVDVLGNSLAC
jgi:hypothetical protein